MSRHPAVHALAEARTGESFGGEVSAPVFSKVMAGAMRLLDVPPDSVEAGRLVLDMQNGDDRNRDASVTPGASGRSSGEHT